MINSDEKFMICFDYILFSDNNKFLLTKKNESN